MIDRISNLRREEWLEEQRRKDLAHQAEEAERQRLLRVVHSKTRGNGLWLTSDWTC